MKVPGPIAINATSLLGPLTGVGQYTLNLAREMAFLVDPAPLLFYGTRWSRDLRPSDPPSLAEGKRMVGRAIPLAFHVARWLQQNRFSAGVRAHRVALYHEPNYLAFRFAGPTVVTVHDLSWIRYPEMHPVDRVRSMNALMPRVMREARRIIVVSEFVRREVVEHYGLDAHRVVAIHNGVGADYRPRNASETAAGLAPLGLAHGGYILCVGTLEPRKNLARCIAAFASLPESLRKACPLVLAGDAGWGSALPPAVRPLLASGQVRLAGYVDAAVLPLLYAGARLFVYPSIYEGFGLPPLEAMACGVPVVVSDRTSLPEVVGDAALQVDPFDQGAIANAMRTLLEDSARAGALAAAGRARSRRFSWRRCAQQTLAVYREAAAS